MPRTPEPELMAAEEQAYAYSWADFTELHPVMVTRFRECFPAFDSGRLLDLGCGTADMTIRFARAYPAVRALGVDGSAPMLAYGAKAVSNAGLGDRIALEQRRLPDSELECGEFDAVIANSVLHHVADPLALWRTAVRCGRAGAAVMLMDLRRPENEDIARRIVTRYADGAPELIRQDFFQSLCAAYTPEEIREQLDAAGLSSFHVETVGECQVLAWGTAPGFAGRGHR